VIKISSFLIITYLYLFKENDSQILNKKDVDEVLAFIRDIWKENKENKSLDAKKYL
jgi:hypothetical protein